MHRKPLLQRPQGANTLSVRLPASVAMIATSEQDAALLGIAETATFYVDGDAFLASPHCYEKSFYVVGGEMPLREGIDLVRLLRRRSDAGLLAWRTRAPAAAWLDAGADLWLPRTATVADLLAGIRAIQRHHASGAPGPRDVPASWQLERAGRRLHTPQRIIIALGESEFIALSAFTSASGETVPYAVLHGILGHASPEADNVLHATMYRLRRRVERATAEPFPLSSRAGIGYAFGSEILRL